MKNYKFSINGNKYSVDILSIEDRIANVEVNGAPYQVEMDTEVRTPVSAPKKVVQVANAPVPKAAQVQASVTPATAAPTSGSVIKSPLPGVVLDIYIKVGDSVKVGQHVLMLEAMKMENNIDADKEGVVKEIRVQRNDSVMEGDVLVVIG